MFAPYWTIKQLLANPLVQFSCVGHQTPKSKVNGPRVHFPYKQELIHQIKDVHHLNNMVNPILPPAPAVEEDPNVLIAEDDGMEVDAEEEPDDEEFEPFEDDHGDGVSDINNDHLEE